MSETIDRFRDNWHVNRSCLSNLGCHFDGAGVSGSGKTSISVYFVCLHPLSYLSMYLSQKTSVSMLTNKTKGSVQFPRNGSNQSSLSNREKM